MTEQLDAIDAQAAADGWPVFPRLPLVDTFTRAE
jgi:hypothetical protein